MPRRVRTPTWPAVSLLHPDVAVTLGDARLGVQEGQPHGALGAQAGVVAAAVLDGLAVELLTQAAARGEGSTAGEGVRVQP